MIAVTAALAVAALGFSACTHPTPRLVWNASPSAPIGLYWVARGSSLARGDLVLATLPEAVRQLAAERGYLPDGVPLVKRIAAIAGETVCSDGSAITINNRVAVERLAADRQGRPLPAWQGCHVLRAGELFLLMKGVPDSFDGRYFGPVETRAVMGRLVPLWIW